MTSRLLSATLLAALSATTLLAQDDRIHLHGGNVIEGCRVTSFDVRNLKYTKGGNNEAVSTDQVAKVELGKFKDVFARGLKDADVMLTQAREQVEQKNLLMAQFGFIAAARRFFDTDQAAEAVGTIDELVKAIPEAGVLPDTYRLKFEYYMSLGQKGAPSALAVAKKFQSDAVGNAWPNGLATEADFFLVLSDRVAEKEYQTRLRGIVAKASGTNPVIAARANVELADSLRQSKDKDLPAAKTIYAGVLEKDGGDVNARAGALLGLGKIQMEEAGSDKEAVKKAMLTFLRVRLETQDSWAGVQSDALLQTMLAAKKWGGPEWTLVFARCRRILATDYAGSDADKQAAGL